jgi:L-threonylcarbamoyladenylate synthase
MAETGTDINRAQQLLESGEVVAIPTETVYGLAANACSADAVAKVFTIKNRPSFDPLIVHTTDLRRAEEFVSGIPAKATDLAAAFWPGPLTLVLPRKPIVPDLVTAGLGTVGIRCPSHAMAATLLGRLAFPLAAPSANPFGYVSPTRAEHVAEQLGDSIAYILDGGPCEIGLESTIVGFERDSPIVYRLGGIGVEALEQVVGKLTWRTHSTSNPRSPGQLQSHYAPKKKVIVGKIEELLQVYPAYCTGILSFQQDFNSPFQFVLSPSGRIEEAAKNLFAGLRFFDKTPVDTVVTEWVPDTGIGRAINDRLARAAAQVTDTGEKSG